MGGEESDSESSVTRGRGEDVEAPECAGLDIETLLQMRMRSAIYMHQYILCFSCREVRGDYLPFHLINSFVLNCFHATFFPF